jgi:hypothetical protein
MEGIEKEKQMNIIEEVKKLDKIPVELIDIIADKVGDGNGWREEGERRGVWIVTVSDENECTHSAFSGTEKHMAYAYKAMGRLLDENPKVKMVVEMSDLLNALKEDEEEDK